MFRSHEDTVRTPIEIEKLESVHKTDKAISDVFKCDICGEPWLTETDVEIHRKKAHMNEIISLIKNQKEHYCLICVRPQGSAHNLMCHIKSDHLLSSPAAQRVEREIFICDFCDSIFFNKRLLITHILYLHRIRSNKTFVVPCPMCHKTLGIHKMWFHLSFHQLNISTTCQICLTGFTSRSKQREHLAIHPSYYHCENCNFSMHKKQYYEDHIRTHKKRSPQLVRGNLRRFFAPRTGIVPWRYRIESRIRGLQLYDLSVCVLCREICASAMEIRRHILVDHAPDNYVKQKPMCACGEEFFNMVLLKHHVFKLKGNHRLMEEDEMPRPSVEEPSFEDYEEVEINDMSDQDLPKETSPEDFEKVEAKSAAAQHLPKETTPEDYEKNAAQGLGSVAVTLPMDCEIFSVQDLGPIEDEVTVP